MNFNAQTALMSGGWLIEEKWVATHLPLLVKMMKGEGDGAAAEVKNSAPVVLSHNAGSVYKVGYYSDLNNIPDGSIAMISLIGPITKYGYWSYGTVDYTALINRLTLSPNIAGIIINIDSPGGECAGTAMFADAIKVASSYKPVIGLIDDGIAASAAMWIASACSEIYTTQKTDMVGSVGVYSTIVDWYKYFESQGLSITDVYAPQSTEKNLDFKEALEGKYDLLLAELKIIAAEFISTVSTNRGERLTSDEWNKGKMFYTKDAIRLGLIDGQKSIDQVIKRINSLISTNKSTQSQTNYSMKFPNMAAFFGFKNEEESIADISLETYGSSLEALIAERDALSAEKLTLNDSVATLNQTISEKDQSIATLSSDKTALETQVSKLTTEKADLETENQRLETLTAGKFSEGESDEDIDPKSDDVDPMGFAFQKEILSRL